MISSPPTVMGDWVFGILDNSHPEAINHERMEYTFTWFIENYSYCLQKNTEVLASPGFFVRGLENTAWRIQLYPRGSLIKRPGYISIFLRRYFSDLGPDRISLKFELSLLGVDGSAVISRELQYTFKTEDGYGCVGFLHISDLLLRQKDALLPQDTLSVRCKMWINDEEIHKVGQGFARTRIGVEHLYFIQVVEGFSALKPDEKKTFKFLYAGEEKTMKARLQLSESSSCDGTINLKITPQSSKKILSTCNLFLLGASGNLTKCAEGDNRADVTRKNISKLPLSLTKKEIMERKEEYLPDDKLTVLCQCSFTTGVKYKKMERTLHEISSSVLNQINNDPMTERLSACSSVIDDLKNLYSSQLMTDVELKTKTKSYQAHKYVLCARSTVFKAMLTEDMDGNNSGCIQVDDFEDDTVENLLHFLYSDSIENLEWDSTIKLYHAADKFAIKKLKLMCSSILLESLSTSNAAELQLLADTHKDSGLQKRLKEFTQNHEEEVSSSDELLKLG